VRERDRERERKRVRKREREKERVREGERERERGGAYLRFHCIHDVKLMSSHLYCRDYAVALYTINIQFLSIFFNVYTFDSRRSSVNGKRPHLANHQYGHIDLT